VLKWQKAEVGITFLGASIDFIVSANVEKVDCVSGELEDDSQIKSQRAGI